MDSTGTFAEVVEITGKVIDSVGVAVIVFGAFAAMVIACVRARRRQTELYRRFRQQLGRSILLGLELLVAADIIRTVAVTPTLRSVAVLAGIVLIRTLLSFSLEIEVSGAWPWQKRRKELAVAMMQSDDASAGRPSSANIDSTSP